jgi:ABC-type Fe3+-hydroxamate transport system substrate-binding protein
MSSSLVDAAGYQHSRMDRDARILSLVPSLTELLFDLGLARRLVGRTNFCVHPNPGVEAIASVGGTKQIDMDKVAALNPTHALVNIDENPKDMADALAEMGIEVVVTHPFTVTDNVALFRLIGGIFNAGENAEQLIRDFDSALADLHAQDWKSHRVLYLIWRKPWMSISAGTYIADMLAQTNWQVIDHQSTARYPEIDLTNTLLAQTDLVLFSTEPFPFKLKHLDTFGAEFPAHANKARLIDAEMVSWYGSRVIAGLRYLAKFAGGVTA